MSIVWFIIQLKQLIKSGSLEPPGGDFAVYKPYRYPLKTNMTVENRPFESMYFLLKIGMFQCYVSFQGVNRIFAISTGDRRISEPSTEI